MRELVMLKKLFFCLLIFLGFSQVLFADLKDPSILSVTEGEPDLNIVECVNALTGDFLVQQQDLVIQGAEPLPLRRFYISGDGEGELRGWVFYPHQKLHFTDGDKSVSISEPNGSTFHYIREPGHKKSKKNKHKKDKQKKISYSIDLSRGVVNTAHGEISARHNVKNNVLVKTGDKTFELNCADGSVRHYVRTSQNDALYLLHWERLPNKNLITWIYDKKGVLKIIATKNPAGNKTYASATFHYTKGSKNFVIQTSDEREVKYEFKKYGSDRYSFESYALKKIYSPELPTENISYDGKEKYEGIFLSKRGFSDEKTITPKYYSCDYRSPEAFRFRVKSLHSPAGAGGALLKTHKFFYDLNQGRTDVVDVHEIKTSVFFNTKNYRPKTIQKFDEKGALHHSVSSEWNKSGELTCKKLLDGHNNEIWKRQFTYDAKGNIQEETYSGNLIGSGIQAYKKRFTYKDNNLMRHQEEDNGACIDYTYLGDTNLVTSKLISDSSGILIRELYEYSPDNQLIGLITDNGTSSDPKNPTDVTERHIKRIHLREAQPVLNLPETIEEKAWDPLNGGEILLKKTVLHYSKEGRVIQRDVYDANGVCFKWVTTYDAKGHPKSETNPLGETHQYEYDDFGNQTFVEEPDGILKKKMSYDKANRLTEETQIGCDGLVRKTTHNYDNKHNRNRTVDFQGHISNYRYDAFDHMIEEKLPTGNGAFSYVTHSYDSAGNEKSRTDANENTTTTEYNARGKPILVLHPDGTNERCSYYPDGKLKSSTDQLGTVASFLYDTLGRVLSKTITSSSGEVLSSESFQYNSFHLISHTDVNGLTTRYGYDCAGRKSYEESETESGLERTSFTYDALGRLHTTQQDDLLTIVEYDPLDRIIEEREEDLEGHLFTKKTYQYDAVGNCVLTSEWTPEGMSSEETVFDSFKRPIKKIDALGQITTVVYDDHYLNKKGQQVLRTITTDPKGIQTFETNDVRGFLVHQEKRSPEGVLLFQEEFKYDLSGNKIAQISTIISQAESKVKTSSWTYDSMHQIISFTEADGTELAKTTQFTYTPTGLSQTETTPNGVIITHRYDLLGRELELSSSDDSIHYSFTHNLLDQVISSYDHFTGATITRTYDAKGRLLEENLPGNLTISTKYDTRGRQTSQSIADVVFLSFTYDPLYLRSITKQDASGLVHYSHHYDTYDPRGQPKEQRTLTGCTVHSTYDLLGRPVSITSPYGTQTILERDAVGNVLSVQTDAQISTYNYTDLSQLSQEKGQIEHTYTYDSHHNRLSKNGMPCPVNLLNHSACYHYDKNGNPIQSTQEDMHLSYDALNRLVSLKKGDWEQRYVYDSWHRRLSTTTYHLGQKSSKTYFLYDQQNEIGACDESHQLREFRILGIGKGAEIGASVAIELDGTAYVPLHDLFGNISHLINLQTKQVADRYQYSVFGEELTFPKTSNPWRYCSKRKDETGLIYFGRRYYLPAQGAWLTPDPKGFIDGPNLYAFVQSNPLLHVDLYGLVAEYNFQESTTDMLQGWALGTANIMIESEILMSQVGCALTTPVHWVGHQVTGTGSVKGDWDNLSISNENFRASAKDFVNDALKIDRDNQNIQSWAKSTEFGIEISLLLYGPVKAAFTKGPNFVMKGVNLAKNLIHPAVRPSLVSIPKSSAMSVSKVAAKEGARNVNNIRNKSFLTRTKIQSYLSNAKSYNKNRVVSDLESIGLKIKGKSPDGRFLEFQDKLGNVRVKIHPPDQITNFDHLHIYNKLGRPLNKYLEVAERTSLDTHIPYGGK